MPYLQNSLVTTNINARYDEEFNPIFKKGVELTNSSLGHKASKNNFTIFTPQDWQNKLSGGATQSFKLNPNMSELEKSQQIIQQLELNKTAICLYHETVTPGHAKFIHNNYTGYKLLDLTQQDIYLKLGITQEDLNILQTANKIHIHFILEESNIADNGKANLIIYIEGSKKGNFNDFCQNVSTGFNKIGNILLDKQFHDVIKVISKIISSDKIHLKAWCGHSLGGLILNVIAAALNGSEYNLKLPPVMQLDGSFLNEPQKLYTQMNLQGNFSSGVNMYLFNITSSSPRSLVTNMLELGFAPTNEAIIPLPFDEKTDGSAVNGYGQWLTLGDHGYAENMLALINSLNRLIRNIEINNNIQPAYYH